MAKKTLRVALIGGGFMGKAHSNAYLKVAKFFKLPLEPEMTCFCDVSAPEARTMARRWGWQNVETDWRRAVARPDVDLVDICTPNNLHREMVLAAAAAGKMIYCEKPLALNVAEAREMLAAARKARVRHFMTFNYRRSPAIGLARRIVEEGRLGRLYHVRACYCQDWIMDPEFPLVWRLKKKVSGSGTHGDINAHSIDLARYLTGEEFVEVSGLVETFIKERPLGAMAGQGLRAKASRKMGRVTVDDAALFLARMTGGTLGSFMATRFAAGRRNYNAIEIYGSKGSLLFDFERMNELQFYSVDDPAHLQGFRKILATDPPHPYAEAWWPGGHGVGYEHGFINNLADLCRAVAAKKPFHPDFEDGLRCQEVLDAVLLSARERRWVKISEMKETRK
jgi:predicted dehydrogenase